MRPPTFDAETLRQHLLSHKIADLPELKTSLGSTAALTVFRKLKSLHYLSSYTHRGRFYTLPEIARFDDRGLWSHQDVWFSRHGTLMATLESWIQKSLQGGFADELADQLHVEVQDALRELVVQGRLRRAEVTGRFLYTAADARLSKDQIRTRSASQAIPLAVNATSLLVSPDELKAAILLFYSLLDEQQRRLFAGLESIRLGYGGDTILAGFLQLDAHTVSRGRQQLLDHDVASGRTRRQGGGRPSIEKKHPTSSR
jgi:hypothetical protein